MDLKEKGGADGGADVGGAEAEARAVAKVETPVAGRMGAVEYGATEKAVNAKGGVAAMAAAVIGVAQVNRSQRPSRIKDTTDFGSTLAGV